MLCILFIIIQTVTMHIFKIKDDRKPTIKNYDQLIKKILAIR